MWWKTKSKTNKTLNQDLKKLADVTSWNYYGYIGTKSKQVGRRTNFSSNDVHWGKIQVNNIIWSKHILVLLSKWIWLRECFWFVWYKGIWSLHPSRGDDDKASGGNDGRSARKWSWCCGSLVGEQRPLLDAFVLSPRIVLNQTHKR